MAMGNCFKSFGENVQVWTSSWALRDGNGLLEGYLAGGKVWEFILAKVYIGNKPSVKGIRQ